MKFMSNLLHADINPLNHKSRNLPLLNVVDNYGRTFHLSWIGFFVAFLSWFAFPPLIHGIIQEDLQLTKSQIANSNIIGLLATLLVRLIVGPLCDRYGPRYVMIGCLLIGAIPTALTPLIRDASHLMIIRFFVGILGGTFVPCQVWITQFFDKNIIGLANALAAGWGNAGGGVTFFLMPAVVSSLIEYHDVSPYWAWRMAFPICPLVIILGISIITIVFGQDTPTGSWGTQIRKRCDDSMTTKTAGSLDENAKAVAGDLDSSMHEHVLLKPVNTESSAEPVANVNLSDGEDAALRTPSVKDIWKVALSLPTFLVALPYLCSFGSELAVEGIISDFYIKTTVTNHSEIWSSQKAGNWAAVFGLLNIFTRPLGGYLSDVLFRYKGLIAKKYWMIFLGIIQGLFFMMIGLTELNIYHLVGMMTGLAVFMEAANGAVFSLVPAIHPVFNGVVSGITGGFGNIGGILFGLIFRFNGSDYQSGLLMTGVACLVLNILVICIPFR